MRSSLFYLGAQDKKMADRAANTGNAARDDSRSRIL